MADIERILCPIDCSPGSKAAIDYALFMADALGAHVEVLHAWDVQFHARGDLSVWMEPHGERPISEVVREEAEAEVARFVQELPGEVAKRLSVRSVRGEPSKVIVETAERERFDMIVMGSHGRTGVAHLALGSVAERVVRHAKCPVITVRLAANEAA